MHVFRSEDVDVNSTVRVRIETVAVELVENVKMMGGTVSVSDSHDLVTVGDWDILPLREWDTEDSSESVTEVNGEKDLLIVRVKVADMLCM